MWPHHTKPKGIRTATAFILVNAEMGAEDEVYSALKKVAGVKESYILYGVYDIIAKIEAESMDELKKIVTLGVRRLDRVRSTLTLLIAERTS
jgi:DNA-binding Lrp family transcriptional regulator